MPSSDGTSRTRGRIGLRSRLAVPMLTLVWVLLALTSLSFAGPHTARTSHPVPAIVIAALFAATQALVIDVQFRRESRAVFLSEIPTLLALLSLSPASLVTTRVVGALLGQAVLLRQYRQPQKLVFNLAMAAAEAGIGVLVLQLLVPEQAGTPVDWVGATLATAISSAYTAVAVALVIELLEGAVRLRVLARMAATAFLQALPVALTGVAVWSAWEDSPWSAAPLAVVTLGLLFAYRAYARLRERHLALERLYRFNQVVSHAPGLDDVLRGVLEQAREILLAERARVTFMHDADSGEGVEVVLSGGGTMRRGAPFFLQPGDWAFAAVVQGNRAVRVARGSRDLVERAWLERTGVRDSIMVPLLGEAGVIGVLGVDNRLGDTRGFEADEVGVLETVASQAAVALRNGELLDRLRHESLHDALTNLPNRMKFQRELEQRLRRVTESPFALGILDLDSFKEVNDTLGHQDGDRLLCEVADRVVTALGGDALVARLGGDEFAVLLDDCATAEAATRLGERLHRALDAPVLLSGIEVDVSGSLGLALAPRHGTVAGVLLKCADQAMYDAKQSGREVRVFDPNLDTSSPSKLALVAELRQAIEQGSIDVHVQPKTDARTGLLCGSEALARWSTPERGVVSPNDFVPLAERSGLVRPLTALVLDRAIEACARWQGDAPGVGVSVNVSVRSLADDGLVRLVDRLLRKHSLPAELLTLEITESHIMADPGGTLDVLHQLRSRGLRLSVDDFGTGYSSLSYLRRLPVNEVKIDRSFVYRMVEEPDDAAIVRSIVELARTLNLKVVAEGVEDRHTWAMLDELSVDEIQGWVVAKAMPIADFRGWIAGRTLAALPA